jgi:hypothetical protein
MESFRFESPKKESAGLAGENEAAGRSNSILLSVEIVAATFANFKPVSVKE